MVVGGSALTRAGVRTLLTERGATVIGVGSTIEPFDRILAETDVIVVLASEALALLETVATPARLLLLSDQWPKHAPTDRAWGIVPSDASPDELWAAIGALLVGLCVLPPQLLATREGTVQTLAAVGDEALTNRERTVLQLLAEGLTNRQIAARTGISEHTVKFHLSSIFSKLGVSSRTEAIRVGAQRGLVVW